MDKYRHYTMLGDKTKDFKLNYSSLNASVPPQQEINYLHLFKDLVWLVVKGAAYYFVKLGFITRNMNQTNFYYAMV